MVKDTVQISIVIVGSASRDPGHAFAELHRWLDSTKLSWEGIVVASGGMDTAVERSGKLRVVSPESPGKGRSIAEAVMETKGEVIVVVEDVAAISPGSLGDAIALVQSDAADITLVDLEDPQSGRPSIVAALIDWIVRICLVSDSPPRGGGVTVFNRAVGRDLFSQSRIEGDGVWNEFLYLARKYGYRIERMSAERAPGAPLRYRRSTHELLDIVRTRLNDRRMRYRIPRRCPVCMSAETGTRLQIDGEIVRACRRCKCRYLSVLHRSEDAGALKSDRADEVDSGGVAETRIATLTARRRLQVVCRFVPFGSRVLELGCGTGTFGKVAKGDFGYSGIDASPVAVRRARENGLDVVRGELNGYVSVTGSYDCLLAFDVMETFPDPHLAFEQIRRLIKPAGVLIITTPDTESLVAEISGDRWLRRRFPQNRILYSRTALLELLDNEGFEVESAASELELREADDIQGQGVFRALGKLVQTLTRRPLLLPCGTVRIVARRRAGSALGERYEKRVAAERAF